MAQNAARSLAEHNEMPRPALRSVRTEDPAAAAGESAVIAEILSDGTVRPVVSRNGDHKQGAWSEGSISGRSWILWWTRRSFSQA